MLETFPQPSEEKLPDYYKSENYISHTDTKRNLFEKGYQFVRGISLKRKLKLINYYATRQKPINKPERTLLDIGCGTGDFLSVCNSNGWIVSGIEPNEKARAIANNKTNNKVFKIEQLLKFEKHSFDVITLWHVLEHLPKLQDHLSIIKNLLKENGTLIIAVPNYNSYDAKFYKEFWAAYDAPRHLWHFSQTAINKLFLKQDMVVKKVLPLKYDAYYVSLLSEKYKSGWMNVFRAFLVGLVSNIIARTTKEYSSLIYIIKNS